MRKPILACIIAIRLKILKYSVVTSLFLFRFVTEFSWSRLWSNVYNSVSRVTAQMGKSTFALKLTYTPSLT